ncbi:UvrD-helicase domain-containing protein [Mycoplasmopsis pullorum]|uniref:UvrD-helicase domain-containing protein n=1 Tax=Mycoplasmopsis pullorum TaxID=48003 RepID=UPI00111AA11A|nr:UvrD-helicase domain-containing protein [Mycoplasmopsis pullorum]TNK84760.1 hypothetical protein C4M92_02910 [Mycoplasmopsis pullorum]
MEISHEQFLINQALKQGFNVKVSAVAGSGKTTTVLLISKLLSDKKILFFTYNRQLKDETQEKIIANKLFNIDIFTFHSFAQNIYKVQANTDDGLVELLTKNKTSNNIDYDLIVIDEAQDLTPIYYHFLLKIMNDNRNKNYQILILGDERQCIYQFLGADSRFLTHADKLFINQHEWKFLSLSKSYRLSSQIASFLNDIFFKTQLIKSGRLNSYSSINYLLVRNNNYKNEGITALASKICKKIHEYGEENIFVLTPTTKTNYINLLIKKIIEINEILYGNKEIAIFTSSNEPDKLVDLELIKNKLVISTFHQTKGLEREVVFLLNFDESYYEHFAVDANKFELMNVTYVSATRAKTELWLVHDDRYQFMQWIDKKTLLEHPYVTFHNRSSLEKILKLNDEQENSSKESSHCTEIIKFLDFKIDNLIKSKFSIQSFETDKTKINTKSLNSINSFIYLKKLNKSIKEDVSNINGTLISILYLIKKDINLFVQHFQSYLKMRLFSKNPKQKINFDSNILANIEFALAKLQSSIDIKSLLYITIIYMILKSGNIAQLNLITYDKCNWLNFNEFILLNSFLDNILEIENCDFEVRFSYHDKKYDFTLVGDVDAIDHVNKIVYEFKFTNETKIDHFYQLITYRFLMLKNDYEKYKDYKFVVYNVRKNVAYELVINDEPTYEIVDILFRSFLNLNPKNSLSDAEFFEYVRDFKHLNLLSNNLTAQISNIEKDTQLKQKIELIDLVDKDFLNSINFTSSNLIIEQQKSNKYIILDFETLHYDQIPIQLAFLVIQNNQIIETQNLYFEIDNDMNLELFWEYVNVDPNNLIDAPHFLKQWDKIKKYFNGEYIIIAHNAPFDMRVLNKALKKYDLEILNFVFLDSIKLLKKVKPNLASYSQPKLCSYFGIEYDAHNALADVQALYQLITLFIDFNEIDQLIQKNPKLLNDFWNI